ncbi:Cell death protease [Quaeritorhiza haematococci]|nr:Cell death protease [Quaeritorhiza haematococci]
MTEINHNWAPAAKLSTLLLVAVVLASSLCSTTAQAAPPTSSKWRMPWFDGYLQNKTAYAVNATPISFWSADIRAAVAKSYAGYINVGPPKNSSVISNMFFWYFPCDCTNNKKKLILYLNGGPGCLVSFFKVNGPIKVWPNGTYTLNPNSWHKEADILYVDQPVGTGYSFTNVGAIPNNEIQVSDMMYKFIRRFLYIFDELQNHDLILSGESFAGQYIPYLARTIIQRNTFSRWFGYNGYIRLAALSIASPWSDPSRMYVSYRQEITRLQLVNDTAAQAELDSLHNSCIAQIQIKALTFIPVCSSIIDYMINYIEAIRPAWCFNYYNLNLMPNNFCATSATMGDINLLGLLGGSTLKNAFHVNVPGAPRSFIPCNANVRYALSPDGSDPAIKLYRRLLELKIPIYLVSGTADFITNVLGAQWMIGNLTWSGATGFQTSPQPWTSNTGTLGTVTSDRGLTFFTMNNAGHFTAGDQPAAGLAYVRWILNGGPV